MLKPIALLTSFAAALTACASADTQFSHQAADAAHDRLAFVQAACGGCHSVEPPGLSPNPQAPAFEAIANRPGLSEDTLRDWLVDAHNYPEVMDFDLQPGQIDLVADHMITLRRADYSPPPS